MLARLAIGERLAPYIGLVGYNNLGDEVLYEAHQKLFPFHKLMPYRKDGIIVEKIADVMHRPLCKHAILGGGTLINDGDVWLAKTERLLNNGSRIFCIGTGVESSAFYGEDDTTSELLKKWVSVLERFEFVGVRGPRSKMILERAGAKKVVVTGDTALSLTEENLKIGPSQGTVGITYGDVPGNPMWGDRAQYRSELIKVIKSIIKSGSKVMLLPVWGIDLESNRSLLREISDPNCSMVEAYDSFSSFSKALQKCDIFIGQKLHSTIIALMNRVPSIMVEYRPKCLDFMSSVGLEEYVVKTSDFTLKDFLKLYEKVQKNHGKIKSETETRILEYKHIQFEHAKKLSAILAHST